MNNQTVATGEVNGTDLELECSRRNPPTHPFPRMSASAHAIVADKAHAGLLKFATPRTAYIWMSDLEVDITGRTARKSTVFVHVYILL